MLDIVKLGKAQPPPPHKRNSPLKEYSTPDPSAHEQSSKPYYNCYFPK